MPVQKYRVETDKGSYEIEVDMPESTVKPVDTNEPGMGGGDPIARFISAHVPYGDHLLGMQKGFQEGVLGGAKGFAEGVVPGVVNGLKDTVRLPFGVLNAMVDVGEGAAHLATDPKKVVTRAYNDVTGMPGKTWDAVKNATSDAAYKAAVDPEGFGKDVGALTGETETAILGSKAVPLAGRPLAQRVGRVVQAIGEKGEWPLYITGAHQIASGNPAGALTMMMPSQLKKGGQSLRIFGGDDPAVVRMGPKHFQATQDQFEEGMIKRNLDFYDEQQAAKQNAENLQAIQAARQGMQPETSFSKTTSANTPAGKESMTTRYTPAEDAAVGGLSPEDKLVAQLQKQNPGMTEVTARKAAKAYYGTDNGPMPTKAVLQVGRPTTPAPSAPVKLDQQAMEDNVRSRASFGYGHVVPEPVPTELADAAVEGSQPHKGTFVMEHGVGATVPNDLTVEAGNPDVPGLTVGSAGKGTPLALNPNPQRPALRISPSPDLDKMMATPPPTPLKPATANVRNVGDFMQAVDDALAGAKSKSKSASGQWKNLSDNDAITAMNAYSSGIRNPQEVLQAILDKRSGRQATHVGNYYLNKQQVPEE